MQDFRPNEDHLSNMRSALQYMVLQSSDSNATMGLFPAWPCTKWSIKFKLHVRHNDELIGVIKYMAYAQCVTTALSVDYNKAPALTTVEGEYNHTTQVLKVDVQPPERRNDLVIMNCATTVLPLL